MFAIFTQFRTLDFQAVASAVSSLPNETGFGIISIATLLLFIGATGKSAQIPLYTWLPDAMEGPTPVSALIHAATMVTAGVYMIGRNAVLFSHAPATMLTVAIIGALTALMAGTIGLVQNDIKRVLAYSTVSQLGYMFLAMGMGAFGAGIFHLYTHAFFKALLFLGSGAVIHALHGEQDIRRMGGLKHELPITYWTFLIGAIAIAGIPPLAGFFSKDEILYETFAHGHWILWSHRRDHRAADGDLHVPPRVPYFLGRDDRTGHERSHAWPRPPSRCTAGHGSCAHRASDRFRGCGWIGIPHALGGHNALHTWLQPAFEAPARGAGEAAQAAETGQRRRASRPNRS
jgi:NADH-quinone oxidoreductase subunit L